MSVQPITFLTKEEASRITASIRTALDRVSTAWADLAERVAEAFDRRADLALGYPSWAEYAEAELRPPKALAAEVRRELVGLLSARGMSTRAIAPTVGVQDSAVRKDLRRMAGGSDGPTSPAERIDPLTGEIIGGSTIATREGVVIAEQQHITLPSAKVVGLDGKSYTRPEKPSETAARTIAQRADKAPQRRPITDAFRDATYDLCKLTEALDRLTADDRFSRNREAIADKNLPGIRRAANTLAGVLAAIETNPNSHEG